MLEFEGLAESRSLDLGLNLFLHEHLEDVVESFVFQEHASPLTLEVLIFVLILHDL